MFVYLFFVLFVLFFVYFFFISVLLLYMNADVHLHLHLQDTKKCLDRPLRFGNTSVQRRERLEIKM
jgi:hypothetical protein